jgi:NAD(P)-dependent dehydrogenase (short-subunit alcohol dehydrogenase family)
MPTKASFFALHQLAGDLPNGGRVLTATKLGGYLGRDGSHADLTAQGGGVGLLKSLHEEWPRLHAKAVDLDPMQPVEAQAQQIFAEFRNPGGRIEVGYPQGRRTIFRTTEKPLDHATPVRLMPSAQWVILATGGARGITASILEGLAPFGVTLVLAGRSPEPSGEEDTALAGLTTIPDLRHHFIREARARNDSIRPADIDREVQRVVRARELHANLARLRALGAQLDYRVADLRDADTTIGLLQDVRARYGRLDGVIHAAGIIEDRLLADKTVESWERVFDTKADSTWLLCSALDPEKLGFLALFTSVAGRYGNRGQTDYAAANELMNRLAWSVRRRWAAHPVRVVAINWGPWAGSGMVSDATRQQFEARGVVPIAHDAGRAFFLDEILRGPLDAVEIIAGQGPWEKHESEVALPQPEPVSPPNAKVENGTGQPAPLRSPVNADVPPSRWPLLWEPSPKAPRTNGDLHLYRTLSLEQDPYLMEHLLDGIPVLPAAAALELMAEAVAELWPDWQVNSVSDFRQLRGIRFDTAEVPVALVAKASTHGDAQGFEVGVAITPDPDGLPFYRATVHLSNMPLEPVPFSPPVRHEPFTRKPAEFYRDWLFHGPCFQTVTRVHGLDHLGLLADAAPTSPGAWRPGSWHDWLFDPGLIDAGPQMALVWTRAQWDRSALPNRFARVSRFGSVSGGALRMHFRVNASRDRDHVRADIAYFDAASGMIKLLVEGMECTASTALNRLGGGWHGEIRV